MNSINFVLHLPVKKLMYAIDFYEALGFEFMNQYSSKYQIVMQHKNGVCLVLKKKDFFSSVTRRKSIDAQVYLGAFYGLVCASEEEINDKIQQAVLNGGVEIHLEREDDELFSRSVQDLDGNIWELYII